MPGGTHWVPAGATMGVATLGVLASVPGLGSAELVDRINAFEVDLAHTAMTLVSVDDAALDAGANIALVGGELLQFGSATQISATRWRLSILLRGRRGTEAAIGMQMPGDRFALIEAAAASGIDLPLASIGSVATVLASSVGDVAGPVMLATTVAGRPVLPPAPVHLVATLLAGGDMRLDWVRRSRAGWRWIDGADSPLGEEREAYRVTLLPTAGAVRTIETLVAAVIIPASDRAGGPVTVQVRQAGAHGESPPAEIVLSAL
ncbi:GTA baseplate fiber-binding domain-containing protein [Sphingomonas sp. PB4P5]|uniref:GTA baseplate fiber-binding domain-containing protein n=1 Tax=Parasphingomonas puruogangriensis TaxID=3096155 RepID=UPI002FC6A2C4